MSDSNIHICCWNGTLDGLNELIAAGGVDINESGEYGVHLCIMLVDMVTQK